MAKTSFKRDPKVAAEKKATGAEPGVQVPGVPAEASVTDLVPTSHETDVAVPNMPMALGQADGDIASSDILTPKLHIVQKVGELSEKFTPGQLLYNKQLVLADKNGTPLVLTVMSIRKFYMDWLEFNDPRMPTIYHTLAEVRAANKWIEWRNNERPPVREAATILVLLRKPDGLEDGGLFPFEYEGHAYAPAKWTVQGTSYSRAAKLIFTAKMYSLRNSLLAGAWRLSTTSEKIGDNFVFVPVLAQDGFNTPEFQQWLAKTFGPAPTVAAEAK